MTIKTIKKVEIKSVPCRLSIQQLLDDYLSLIFNHPVKVIFIALLLSIAAGMGVTRLYFQSDFRIFFSEQNPQLQAFEELQKVYSKTDNVLLVIAPGDGNVFSRETLAVVEKATDDAWKLPHTRRVDSITNFQHSFAEGDTIMVDDLVRRAETLTPAQIESLKQTTLAEPLLLNRLVSSNGNVTAINITAQLPDQHGDQVAEITLAARQLAGRIESSSPAIKTYLTGGIIMDHAFAEQSEADMKILVPAMLTVALVFLSLVLRNVFGVLAITVVLGLSVFAALGLAGWLGIGLSPPSITAPNIIMTIAIADCVHVLSFMLLAFNKSSDRSVALAESMKVNIYPVFITSVLTIVGFLSLNTSDSPPFRDLGNITALGTFFAFLLTVTLFPAMLKLLPLSTSRRSFSGFNKPGTPATWILKHRKWLFAGTMSLAVLGILLVPTNELNDKYVEYFDTGVQFRDDTDFTSKHLTGIYYIDYSIENNRSDTIADPQFLDQLDKFRTWLSAQPETRYVFSISDIFKKINMNMHGDQLSWYRLPDNERLAAQYLTLYEMSLPYGLDLNDRLRVDKKATRLSVGLNNLSSREIIEFQERTKAWLQQNAPSINHDNGTGMSVMFAHIGQRNISSMLLGVAIAFCIISLLLIGVFRSVKIGLLSLVPNILPALMAFGLWAVLDGQVGLAVSAVAAITLGIIVDDTVHFLSKYLYARRSLGKPVKSSIHYSITTVGSAITVTTIALVLGFLTLSLSSFKINASMGMLTAIVFIFALMTDMLLMPQLLMKAEARKS